ncbi:hypothetical protein GGTG_02517 [Gaeumannomyces tritici R3-111a-1]|uniref:Uncharacterized protein n=1 Tax=Gaeumannomyces tritici (strain R3-111a-1) TaxID=644352 RepID=J3NML1_GAET3|nr:hypothetical protein GGTG_02517 [Gaeumannomyces tritici R3-111a-1]EJT82544.1 hypothetical protein GGTG_02517 [Gaeumannomyces tritici R3-111a-1]
MSSHQPSPSPVSTDLALTTRPRLRQMLTYADNLLRTLQSQGMAPVMQHALELHRLMLKSALNDEPHDPLDLLGLLDLIHRAERFVKKELSPAMFHTCWSKVRFMVAPIAAVRRAVMTNRYIDVLPRVVSHLGLEYPLGLLPEHHEDAIQIFSTLAARNPQASAHMIFWVCHNMGLDPASVRNEVDHFTKGRIPKTIPDIAATILDTNGWGAAQENFIMDILARDFRDLTLVHDGEDPAWGAIIPALRQTIIALASAISNIRHYETDAAEFDVPELVQHITVVAMGEAERRYKKLFHAGRPIHVSQAHMAKAKQWRSEVWNLLVDGDK